MFIEVLKKLLAEKGVTAAKMLADCNIGKNQFTYWKKNNNIPSGDVLQKIADYFGVSVDYLLSGEQNEKTDGLPAGLLENPTKAEFIKLLPLLPDEDIEYLLKVAKAILKVE